VAASQISRSISSSEKNHGLRFEGILKIQFARKSTSKGQKPANSITSEHPTSQPAQGIQNSSRTTKKLAKEIGLARSGSCHDELFPALRRKDPIRSRLQFRPYVDLLCHSSSIQNGD
jgi:hypothetical protein